MKNKLTDLNNHLFAQLERLGDEGLSPNVVKEEVMRTDAIVKLSNQIINNARLSLDAAKLMADKGSHQWRDALPAIEGKPPTPNFKNEGGNG